MAANQNLKEFVLDQLSDMESVSTKNMFGGVGFFFEGKMFGMIGGGSFRLKVDDSNKEKYTSRGISAFMSSDKKQGMPYYEVPPEILENNEELLLWSRESIKIAFK